MRYQAAWLKVLDEVHRLAPKSVDHFKKCPLQGGWDRAVLEVTSKLGGRLDLLQGLDDIFESAQTLLSECWRCCTSLTEWRADVKMRIAIAPSFSSLL
jgi:hypothetical protein